MEHIFIYPRADFEAGKLKYKDIKTLIEKHENHAVPDMANKLSYYLGKHDILNRVRKTPDAPNAQPVCNHAKDISDIASSYF